MTDDAPDDDADPLADGDAPPEPSSSGRPDQSPPDTSDPSLWDTSDSSPPDTPESAPSDIPDEGHDCPHCDRTFARPDYRDLHLGVDHGERLSAAERERYEDALAEEERRLRLFRYKALFVLVLVYFGFIVLYAFSLGGR